MSRKATVHFVQSFDITSVPDIDKEIRVKKMTTGQVIELINEWIDDGMDVCPYLHEFEEGKADDVHRHIGLMNIDLHSGVSQFINKELIESGNTYIICCHGNGRWTYVSIS